MNCKGMIKYLPVVLLLCACTENELLLKEHEAFAVRFSASGIATEVATRAVSPLADGATLRILAFRRIGESPDLSTDKYMGEGTYRAVNGNGTLEAVNVLLLRAGTYDFYALTPALAVTNPDNDGGSPACTVSVGHSVDYATSLTVGRTVSEASPAVVLDDLGRHCAKLIFALQPKAGNITSVRIESAGLSNMTHAPVEAVLCTQLPVAGVAQSDAVTIAGSEFSTPDADLKTSAATVVLPRTAGKFQFRMNAVFNGMAAAEFVADMPETLAFAPGTQYTFSLKMKGGSVQLILEVLPWSGSVMSGQDNIGAFTPVVIHIGTWEHVEIPGETGNGSTTVGTGQWRPNPELDAEIGAFGLTSVGGEGLPWASEQGVPGETGGGNTDVRPGDSWGTEDVPGSSGGGNTDVRPGGSWGTEDVPGSSGGGNTNIGSGNSWGTENVPGSVGGGNTNMSSGNSWHTEDIPANTGGDAADPASE